MEYIVAWLFGMAMGLLVSWFTRPKTIGNLRMDRSDPDGPYLFLELNRDFGAFKDDSEVILRVKVEDYISQK